jgi:VWFA-related protein
MRALCFLIAASLLAQQGSPDPNVVFRTQGNEVLLEVVVRDQHGKLVNKLDPSQVAVFEDGVKQQVTSFRFVPGSEVRAELRKQAEKTPLAAGSVAPKPPSNPLRTVNVVCLVLSDLTPDTRAFAFRSAQKFVDKELRPDTFIGVFSLDATGLRPVFPFSNDRTHLVKAIELASMNQLPPMSQGSASVLNGLSLSALGSPLGAPPGLASGVTTATVGPAGVSVVTGASGDTSISGIDTGSAANPLGTKGNIAIANIEGLREIDNLLRLVRQLSQLPFQKTVLLMSSGLTRPPDQIEYWDSLIKAANKGGVTFYGFDVNSTCADFWCNGPSEASKAMLQSVAGLSQSQSNVGFGERGPTAPGGSSTPGPSPTQQLMTASHQTDFLRYGVLSANRQEALRELAESTGGFLIATNNTDGMLAKVMDDVDTHYEISYRPTNPSADGHFKKVDVKLARANLHAETRSGYYAVPDTGEGPLAPGDFAALDAINAKAHAFDYRSRAFRFGKERYAIAWEVPIASLKSTPDPARGVQRYHSHLLALVKDEHGEIVERVTKDVPAEVADQLVPVLSQEPMIYEHAVKLGPGRYTVETAVVDREGNRSATETFSFESAAETGPALSDIILLRRVSNLDRPPDSSDPFEIPGKRAQPYLSSELPAKAKPYVYFVAYPEPSGAATLRVQFVKDGRVLATQKSPLPRPDESGAVPMAIEPPAGAGAFEVRVSVEQGRRTVQRALKYSTAAQ